MSSFYWRNWLSLILGAVLSLPAATGLAFAATIGDGKPIVVQDLAYGESLYYFYQQRYFDAAVNLMVAQELGRLEHQPDEGELLLGGLYLSYGLHQDAEEIFKRLIDRGVSAQIRDQTWLSIGKARYKKGLYEDAVRALEQIGDGLDKDSLVESRLLLANVLMLSGEYQQAAKILNDLPGRSDDTIFARFNLGIALYKGGHEIEGAEILSEVGEVSSDDEEVKALRDKANLAIGYALLAQEETKKARAFFERVRVKGPFSSKALLGLGWTYAMSNQYQEALTPWLELRSRERLDSAGYEALLAVAHALEKLEAYPQAMQSYQEAIKIFNEETFRLDAAIKEVRAGKLLDDLVTQVLGDEHGGLSAENEWLKDVPEVRFIAHIVADHRFHEAVKNLRDLRLLQQNLDKWSETMPIYEHMLQLRQQAYEERLPKLLPDQGIYRVAAFKDERVLYEEEFKRIVREHDIAALATAQERTRLDKLDAIKLTLASAAPTMDKAQFQAYEEKYKRLRGMMEWDISTSYQQRLWNIRKSLNELRRELEKTEQQQQALQLAKQRAPKGFEGFGRQIKFMDKRIGKLKQETQKLYQAQRERVEEIITAEFAWLKDRIAEYLDQAQFSIARLRDMASGEKGR